MRSWHRGVFGQWKMALGISFFFSFFFTRPHKNRTSPVIYKSVVPGAVRRSQGKTVPLCRPWPPVVQARDSGGLGRHLGAAVHLQGPPPSRRHLPSEAGHGSRRGRMVAGTPGVRRAGGPDSPVGRGERKRKKKEAICPPSSPSGAAQPPSWRRRQPSAPRALFSTVQCSSVQSLSRVRLFATPWTAARQASLSITNSRSSLKLMSIESVMPSSHLILCHPLLLLPSVFPSIRVFSSESALHIRWPKYWSFSFSISPSNEYSGLISFGGTGSGPEDTQSEPLLWAAALCQHLTGCP